MADVPVADVPVAVVLAGAHGHGQWHLRNLRRLVDAGRVRLVGICDLTPVSDELLAGFDSPVQSPSLTELIARTRPNIVVIATPIHTHADLTLAAARAGVHILLEKPPAPTLAAYRRIEAGVSAAGVSCQVGFQSLGSQAVLRAAKLVRDGTLGAVHGISAAGAWQRDSTYYARARWAGRRRLDGVDVVDGALTNPFAHALATALRVDGSEDQDLAGEVELELLHAYDIESDDTASLRLHTGRGTTITVAVTLCAARPSDPYLVIHGERGRAVLWYTRDILEVERGLPGAGLVAEGRVDLLENLAEHVRHPQTPLLVPLPATLAFMQAVEAVRRAPAPVSIPRRFLQVEPIEVAGVAAERRTLPGVEIVVAASADRLALFSELGAPWAPAPAPARTGRAPDAVAG